MSIVGRGKEFLKEEHQSEESTVINRIVRNVAQINSFIENNAQYLSDKLDSLDIPNLLQQLQREHAARKLPDWYKGTPPIPEAEFLSGAIVGVSLTESPNPLAIDMYVPKGAKQPEQIVDLFGADFRRYFVSYDFKRIELIGLYSIVRLFYPAWEEVGTSLRICVGKSDLTCELRKNGEEARIGIARMPPYTYRKVDFPTPDKIRDNIGAAYISTSASGS